MSDMSSENTTATEVLAIVAAVLETGEHEVLAQPVLAAHQWDSLASLEALAQLESRFGVSLDLRAFHAALTLDDLTALVEKERTGSDA